MCNYVAYNRFINVIFYIYSPEKCHKVHQLSKTDALYSSLQVVHFGILYTMHHTLIFLYQVNQTSDSNIPASQYGGIV